MNDVANYYEKNKNRFLRFGGGNKTGSIHRKLFAPGVRGAQNALLYVNRLIEELLKSHAAEKKSPLRLLDMGCGVGGIALWRAKRLGMEVTGITHSGIQITLFQQHHRRCFPERMYHTGVGRVPLSRV